jgi:hypothetical protein
MKCGRRKPPCRRTFGRRTIERLTTESHCRSSRNARYSPGHHLPTKPIYGRQCAIMSCLPLP